MTREEFESILEEAYIDGYNTAIEDIQEDILDEEAYDLEGEYDYYSEMLTDYQKRRIVGRYKSVIPAPGESDKHFKKRKSNILRADVASKASNTNFRYANNIAKIMNNTKDVTGKVDHDENLVLDKIANNAIRGHIRMDKAAKRYAHKTSADAAKYAALVTKHELLHGK